MLPVSQYEALLAEVRGLRQQAQHVQELAIPLITNPQEAATSSGLHKVGSHSIVFTRTNRRDILNIQTGNELCGYPNR